MRGNTTRIARQGPGCLVDRGSKAGRKQPIAARQNKTSAKCVGFERLAGYKPFRTFLTWGNVTGFSPLLGRSGKTYALRTINFATGANEPHERRRNSPQRAAIPFWDDEGGGSGDIRNAPLPPSRCSGFAGGRALVNTPTKFRLKINLELVLLKVRATARTVIKRAEGPIVFSAGRAGKLPPARKPETEAGPARPALASPPAPPAARPRRRPRARARTLASPTGHAPARYSPAIVLFNTPMSIGFDTCASMPAARDAWMSSENALAVMAMIGMSAACSCELARTAPAAS